MSVCFFFKPSDKFTHKYMVGILFNNRFIMHTLTITRILFALTIVHTHIIRKQPARIDYIYIYNTHTIFSYSCVCVCVCVVSTLYGIVVIWYNHLLTLIIHSRGLSRVSFSGWFFKKPIYERARSKSGVGLQGTRDLSPNCIIRAYLR
jgi:hypothetical protein